MLCYLQLCLASDIYFITLIKRMEYLHSAHIYMDSISWGTKSREEYIRPKQNIKTTQQNMAGMCTGNSRSPVDSIREAVLTVSPKRQYRGIVRPTTPATQGPENTTKRMMNRSDVWDCIRDSNCSHNLCQHASALSLAVKVQLFIQMLK